SNAVTTVSPHHAWEAHHTDVGCGLSHTLHLHQDKFCGILNGIDNHFWNPETDRYIPEHYSIDNIDAKTENKKALRERLLLREVDKPIVAYIGRLDAQKGVHLVHHGIYHALYKDAQFVLLGSATGADINAQFQHEKNFLNDNPDVHLELGFNEELAHLIYAGADMIIVPSNYEPCGLTQMIGLKYGTVPIVRAVGGLVNTVFDRDYDSTKPPEKRNGYVFNDMDYHAVEFAMERALWLWYNEKDQYRMLVKQGMEYDYSWNQPASDYLDVYESIRVK
ncbi:MAG: glycosyltransferase, partial [Rivularia sp. (in: cyanobacteria)]